MQICGISDIHGNLYNKIPKCDVLCICGDIIPLNIQRDHNQSIYWWHNKFVAWVDTLECEKVLVVPGNHDFYIESLVNQDWIDFKEKMSVLTNGKVEFLVNHSYTYKGIKFYGCPYIAPILGMTSKWAFEDTNEYENPFEGFPSDTDVLLTHENPNYNFRLRDSLKNINNLKLHLFGHWHDGISYADLKQQNCSLLNDSYNFRENIHIPVFEVKKHKFTIDELYEDADLTLMNEEMSGDNPEKIKQYTNIRDFLLDYFRLENDIERDTQNNIQSNED